MKGREIMAVVWTVFAFLGITAWIIFTAFGGAYCVDEEDPFIFVKEVLDATKGKLNLGGRIICATLTSIACIPIWIFYLIGIVVMFAVGCIVGAFWFLFKDRSKDKEECNGNCVECPREHDYTPSDTPQIDFESIHRDMFKD